MRHGKFLLFFGFSVIFPGKMSDKESEDSDFPMGGNTMARESSGVSLSTNFFLRDYYKADTKAFKASVRTDYSNHELSYEDGLALRRAVKKLGSFEYSDDENKETLSAGILAYIDTYNNALSSSSKSSEKDISRYSKQLKRLSSQYSDELKAIGITVNKDGSLTANENLLSKASPEKLKAAFSSDGDFMKSVKSIGKRLSNNSYEAIYSDLTGSGANLNITL